MTNIYFLIWALSVTALSKGLFGWRHKFSSDASAPLDARVLSDVPASKPTSTIHCGMECEAVRHAVADEVSRMQSHFFSQAAGTWPGANDWTSSVAQTYVAAVMKQLSTASVVNSLEDLVHYRNTFTDVENILNGHFAHLLAFYYNQDAFGIMQQAHDDMLWLVLGWLELIRTACVHSALHWNQERASEYSTGWHGNRYTPTFAHRARVFYDILHRAWDTELCGGGLTWDPKLEPYKNTVTNTLFISAAVDMYLYHPGDNETGPFRHTTSMSARWHEVHVADVNDTKPHDTRYLQRAIEAHKWLQAVDLLDSNGLYVDGYHISGEKRHDRPSTPEQCDVRNEMLYTYNQGIILSGMRGLWDATGNKSYLIEGHELIQNVIRATGWDGKLHGPEDELRQKLTFGMDIFDDLVSRSPWPKTTGYVKDEALQWHPLGRGGILHEFCDANGDCGQDAQTFKGVFFHHLAKFCKPLPLHAHDVEFVPGISHLADCESATLHSNGCAKYASWVYNNARAAYTTRDEQGIMGGWWGADIGDDISDQRQLPSGATDVVNLRSGSSRQSGRPDSDQTVMGPRTEKDSNDRGRGRTLETHASGVSVMRCLLEMLPYLFDGRKPEES